MNYGRGDLFNFHGAFAEKKDAMAKEAKVTGAFIKPVWYRDGMRYGVLTRNPRARKKNVEWGTYEKGVFHPWTRRPKTRKKPAKRKRNILPLTALDALADVTSLKSLFMGKPKKKKRRSNANVDINYFAKALQKLYPGRNVAQLTTAQLSQVLRYAQALKDGKANPPKRGNPSKRNYADATELYTEFHGRAPKGVKEFQVHADDYDGHPELGQLGRLVSLTIGDKDWRKKIEWGAREAPALASEPGGKQLYIIGGSQNLDGALASLPIKASAAKVKLGFAYKIEYFTQKGFDNFQPVTYYHDLGEETGERPRVVYDKRRKRIHLVGGAYTVKPEGIVN
jgi:hypothetical protein